MSSLRDELVCAGCPAVGCELDIVLRFLIDQEFASLDELAGSPPICELDGAAGLPSGVATFLQEVQACFSNPFPYSHFCSLFRW